LAITTLPSTSSTRAGVGVGTFLAIFAAAYALRDVLKEAVRGWITGRLMRLYGQRVVTLRLPRRIDPQRRVLLETRETFDVAAESFADDLEGGPAADRGHAARHLGEQADAHRADDQHPAEGEPEPRPDEAARHQVPDVDEAADRRQDSEGDSEDALHCCSSRFELAASCCATRSSSWRCRSNARPES